MPFTCKLCSNEIQVGEAMVPNIKGEVAHDSCVQRECQIPKATVPPITISPDQKVTLKIERIEVIGAGFNKMVTVTPYIEPCLMPQQTHFCEECRKPAISMCPVCRAYVHHGFGYNDITCSLKHEAKCDGAKKLRELPKSQPKPAAGPNGKHVVPKKKGGK